MEIKVEKLFDVDLASICGSVKISGEGVNSADSGIYVTKDYGKTRIFSRGRLFFVNKEKAAMLVVMSGKNEWFVCDDKRCSNPSLRSNGGAGNMNPVDPVEEDTEFENRYSRSWGYLVNGTFQKVDAKVECIMGVHQLDAID